MWILQDNTRSLVHLSKKNLVFQCMILNFTVVWSLQDNARSLVHKHDLETLLLCGSYMIMQDPYAFSKKINHDLETLLLVDLTRLCKITCASFQKNILEFQCILETLIFINCNYMPHKIVH